MTHVQKLGEVAKVVTGKTPPTRETSYYGFDFPFIKIPDLGSSVYIHVASSGLSGKGAALQKNLRLPPGTVLLSCIATVGKVGITSVESFTNQQINGIIPSKKINPLWLYYYLLANQQEVKALGGGGSVYTNVSKSKLEAFKIALPSLKTQEEISSLIYSFDKKIELNRRMNGALERAGRVLFKKLFSTGDHKEWPLVQLGKYVSLERGFSYSSKNLLSARDGFPMINLGNFSINGEFERSNLKYAERVYKKRNVAEPGDLLIANTDITQDRAVLGSVISTPNLNRETIFSHHVSALRNRSELPNAYLYFLLRQPEFRSRAMGFATGTTVLALPSAAVEMLEFRLPPKKLLRSFDLTASKILEEKERLRRENSLLEPLRDSLLPRLISGKVAL